MEREEIEAMWERIKALEENSLKISKTLGEIAITTVVGLVRSLMVPTGKFENFKAYMEPKSKEALEGIANAQNPEQIIDITRQFSNDSSVFTGALLK